LTVWAYNQSFLTGQNQGQKINCIFGFSGHQLNRNNSELWRTGTCPKSK